MKKLKLKAIELFLTTLVIISLCVIRADYLNAQTVSAISLTKMNVLYIGVDNPMVVAVSGCNSEDIEVISVDNLVRIKGKDGEYIINPIRPGVIKLAVKAKGSVVQEAMFRVKGIPDPVVMVNGQKGGKIEKDVLAAQEEVLIFIENFDFDLKFSTKSFSISTTDKNGNMISIPSETNKLNDQQKNLIKNLKKGQRINFEEVKAIGPDGAIRDLPAIVFEII